MLGKHSTNQTISLTSDFFRRAKYLRKANSIKIKDPNEIYNALKLRKKF